MVMPGPAGREVDFDAHVAAQTLSVHGDSRRFLRVWWGYFLHADLKN
jgi:hypothetical protein